MVPESSPMEADTEDANEDAPSKCSSCGTTLELPWICCVQCQPHQHICARCFSFGVEFRQHENDHPYIVMRYNFPIFEGSMSAAEEITLLTSIQEYGLGNWSAVSGRLKVKTPEECERHYFKHYVENPSPPLPEFPDPDCWDRGAPIVFKLSDNPPRPPEGSALSIEMAGYSAARGDFNVERDNFFEMDICNMAFSDTDDDDDEDDEDKDSDQNEEGLPRNESQEDLLCKELKMAVLDVYRHCLVERQRRKKIIRNYGLINQRRWYCMLKRRYEKSLSVDFLRPFMRLFPPITFDKYLESLHYEKQLKAEILQLQEFRQNGITRLRSVKCYYQMKERRDQTKAERHQLADVLNRVTDHQSYLAWLAQQSVPEGSAKNARLSTLPRRTVPRLNISGMMGFEKLNIAEREMCSEVRLVPMAYLEFSQILISECAKQGYLRLAQARNLIKIDVNKTRKMYDFLVQEGQINKEPLC